MTTTENEFVHQSLLTEEEREFWRGFLGVHAAIVRRLDHELRAQSGLSLSSLEVLNELTKAPRNRLRMAELADRLLFARSGVTRLVDRLERDGYLERCDCDHDGRGVYAILTERGFQAYQEGLEVRRPTLEEVYLELME